MKTFEDHLKEREAQNGYASTRLWAPRPHLIGMRGERALAKYFNAEQSLTNKPMGDGGVDIWLALRSAIGLQWFRADAKGSTYGDQLRVDCLKIRPHTIYVLVHVSKDEDRCVGWEWGSTLARQSPINWCGNGVFVHALSLDKLRDMIELKERFAGYRHE